jgi:hypothetical protein
MPLTCPVSYCCHHKSCRDTEGAPTCRVEGPILIVLHDGTAAATAGGFDDTVAKGLVADGGQLDLHGTAFVLATALGVAPSGCGWCGAAFST